MVEKKTHPSEQQRRQKWGEGMKSVIGVFVGVHVL